MTPARRYKIRKIIFWSILAFLLILLALTIKPGIHLWNAKSGDTGFDLPGPGYTDDVSRLNKTAIDSLIPLSSDSASAIRQLREILSYAKSHKLSVSIAGARHSMGGHTIAPQGVVVNMLPFKDMELDSATGILTVGAGALWAEIIPYLNSRGRAVSIMQSDNAFSVGGSVSVNCHGWQHNKAPISSTVISFILMNADGKLLQCSRTENAELFSLVLGGYGLFGIILELKLQTVPNEVYSYHRLYMSSEKYLQYYSSYIDSGKNIRMVYGRLNVNKENFLGEAMLSFFRLDTGTKIMPALNDPTMTDFKRSIFLGSKEDDYGKELRWHSEKVATKMTINKKFSRNQIMNDSPELYMNRSRERTDILHEYFIPRKHFIDFILRLQKIVPAHQCDLLNVTIRNVYRDEDTYLKYAREEMFAFVMFFNQSMTEKAEEEMKLLTGELIKAALDLNGVYYLPYRLHADDEQIRKAYPMIDGFFKKKKIYDPDELFQNKFYIRYGKL
jgi:FAD/FMN-containing dehydrogenase